MILVDTAPLVALCDARDPYHKRAVDHLGEFVPAGLSTGEAILAEVCFHLPYSAQRQRLRGVLHEFGVALLSTPDDVTPDVFDWLAKYGDHEPDWADAWLAVMSARIPRAKVWTYDQEFRAIWRRPNGTRIPLAV